MNVLKASLWGIILAGGEGERLSGFVREQFGSAIPKQFCTFFGRRTMLERTINRARLLIPPERLVVSGTVHHDPYILRVLGTPPPCTVVLQPANRDTAPGILLPLIHILRKDPRALVTILPADHFILPGHRFMRAIAAAAQFVADKKIDIPVLLAVKPDRPESEYGWIKPGQFMKNDDHRIIRQVEQFVEKPLHSQAEHLLKEGWLWNTMVIVVQAKALMRLVRKRLPDLASLFTGIQRRLGGSREQDCIEKVYQTIPKTNFSISFLSDRDVKSLVLPVENICWSDWGTKERILETATTLGLRVPVPTQMPHVPVTIPA